MVEHLDEAELEAVLAHEVAHTARRDYLVAWLATVLRDAFFYLPAGRVAYRQIQEEQEPACDDLASGVTRRPLALASALVKSWQPSLGGAVPQAARGLVTGTSIEWRVQRLLAGPPSGATRPQRGAAFGIGGGGLMGLLALEVVTAISVLAPMMCSPVASFGRLLG
jgi:hypothetical protein